MSQNTTSISERFFLFSFSSDQYVGMFAPPCNEKHTVSRYYAYFRTNVTKRKQSKADRWNYSAINLPKKSARINHLGYQRVVFAPAPTLGGGGGGRTHGLIPRQVGYDPLWAGSPWRRPKRYPTEGYSACGKRGLRRVPNGMEPTSVWGSLARISGIPYCYPDYAGVLYACMSTRPPCTATFYHRPGRGGGGDFASIHLSKPTALKSEHAQALSVTHPNSRDRFVV